MYPGGGSKLPSSSEAIGSSLPPQAVPIPARLNLSLDLLPHALYATFTHLRTATAGEAFYIVQFCGFTFLHPPKRQAARWPHRRTRPVCHFYILHCPVLHFTFLHPPNPANPINDSDKIPAINKVSAVPFTVPGTSAKSRRSRNPAIRTKARVKPAPAPKAYVKLSTKP